MKKQTRRILDRENYLLGTNCDGEKVWLVEPQWDCGWYWGLGYVEIYNKCHSDINVHTHFDSLFLEKDIFTSYKNYFKETTLENREIWRLLDYMKTLYRLKEYAHLLYIGGIYITDNDCKELLNNDEERDRINRVLIPAVWDKVVSLLTKEREKLK